MRGHVINLLRNGLVQTPFSDPLVYTVKPEPLPPKVPAQPPQQPSPKEKVAKTPSILTVGERIPPMISCPKEQHFGKTAGTSYATQATAQKNARVG